MGISLSNLIKIFEKFICLSCFVLFCSEFRLMGTHSALNEMQENIEQTRTVWHMQLDHQRNRVLRVNLLISICSLGGLMCTLPAAFFGMNLGKAIILFS